MDGLRTKIGGHNYDEYVAAVEAAQKHLADALAETEIPRARKALDEASSRIWVAEKRLKAGLTGSFR